MTVRDARDSGERPRPRVVLVVEDDAELREEVCETLRTNGYGVIEAADGDQALRILLDEDTRAPALILLDLWLPVVSGWELSKILKSYHRLAEIPILYMSAGPSYSLEIRAASDWLAKPFSAEALLARVQERCGTDGN